MRTLWKQRLQDPHHHERPGVRGASPGLSREPGSRRAKEEPKAGLAPELPCQVIG